MLTTLEETMPEKLIYTDEMAIHRIDDPDIIRAIDEIIEDLEEIKGMIVVKV